MRSLVKFLVITVLVGFVGAQFLPDVIHVPNTWPRLPRVEFVHEGAAVDSVPAPPPAPIAAAPPETSAIQLPPIAAAPSLDAAKSARQAKRAAKAKPKPKPKPKREELPEEDGWYATEPTAMIVPVRVFTEIELSDSTRIPTPPAPEVKAGEPWPLVCGEVVDSAGAGLEGAEVRIESNGATERTDPKGRFCLPSPTRKVTLIVSAQGRESVRYAAELEGRSTQVRIALTPAH
jgi:hypothetical protein